MQRAFHSIFFATLPLATISCLLPFSTQAQVTPDGTTSTTVNQDGNNFTIDQGDRVGDNLFHSFDEFSVPTLGSAVFNNAGDIANIFSRVTGGSISSIDGLLGASGTANLYLINPNGIIFGENASLNLGGSFFASTADSLLFEGDAEFSAVNPTAPPLLEVSIPIGLNFRDNPGDISNRGNLAVEQDFTLSGGNLDLQGRLQAKGDLTLQATDTLLIRDSADNPFVAAANGELLVQGNQNIDIFALNHFNSGLLSGGDLVLRSASAVSGDARYSTGGNFKIEQLDDNLGNFVSLFDPIVFANGDISFNSYEGASLHVLAGGSVNIGSIIITETGTAETSINPTNAPELANITLSNDTQLTVDGSTQPTVDIRAGIDWNQLGELPGNFGVAIDVPSEFFGTNATSADINIGEIGIAAPDGLVFLSNQYVPNTSLPDGNIQIGTILTRDDFFNFSGNSAAVVIDTSNNLTVGNLVDSSSEFGIAGDITLIANNEIFLDNSSIFSSALENNMGGNIDIQSKHLSLNNNAIIGINTFGEASAGNLTIDTEKLTVEDSSIQSISSGLGNVGTITISADSVLVSGDLVNPDGSIGPSGIDVSTQAENGGDSESIIINTGETGSLTVRNGGQISAVTFGSGSGGNISIDSNSIELTGDSTNSGLSSGIFVSTIGSGNGGNLEIRSNSLIAKDGAEIGAETSGVGDAGNIDIDATSNVTLQDDANFSASSTSQGNAGDININTNDLIVENSQIGSTSNGRGGELNITASNITVKNNTIIDVNAFGQDNGGNLNIDTANLTIENSIIQALTRGSGNAGTLTIDASNSVLVSGDFNNRDGSIGPSGISVQTLAENGGDAGDLIINTGDNGTLVVSDGGQISAGTSGSGSGGNISIDSNSIELIGSSLNSEFPSGIFASTESTGRGGELNITASNITVRDNAVINVSPFGQGNSGNLNISTANLTVENSAIQAATSGSGKAGSLSINASNSILISGDFNNRDGSIGPSGINVSTLAENGGDAGDLIINTGDNGSLIVSDGGQISAGTFGSGSGGNISIDSNSIELIGDSTNSGFPSGIFVSTIGSGNGGDVEISSNRLTAQDGGQISAGTFGSGSGGNISIDSNSIELIGDSTNSEFPSGVFVPTIGSGNSGDVEISSNRLIAQDRAQIDAETSGAGEGGDININTRDNLTLQNNVGFSASSVGQGNGGNITIDTNQLSVENNSFINSSARSDGNAGTLSIQSDSITLQNSILGVDHPQGQAGNLNITTDSLSQNQGEIIAETGLNTVIDGENVGANINLEISDSWRFENESIVSATAFGDADGGNVNINQNLSDTEFLLFAFPPTGSNGSDIIANAEQGDGGRINITAAGIFGIEFRDSQTSLNDFTVTSDFGLAGETIINRTVEDPTSGLINLPASVGDASDQISQNPCQQGVGSQFIVTGKGGLPPNPTETLNSESARVDLIEPVPSQQPTVGANGIRPNPNDLNSTAEALPAQGWVFNDKGEVTLMAYKTTDAEIKRSSQATSNSCSAQIDK